MIRSDGFFTWSFLPCMTKSASVLPIAAKSVDMVVMQQATFFKGYHYKDDPDIGLFSQLLALSLFDHIHRVRSLRYDEYRVPAKCHHS
ncbi:MAG: hypothetical protein U0T56_00030 [Ferruginibacter sp.]